jgi:two-component system CheB/CheR fusion protein
MSPLLRGRTVLCVDDKPELLELLEDALTHAGARVIKTTSAREALAMLRAEPVDALVSDVKMPQMNGHELVRAVRASPDPRRRAMPAIAVSGEDSWKYLDPFSAASAGFDYHYTKPVTPSVLIEHLAKMLEQTPRRKRTGSGKIPRVP